MGINLDRLRRQVMSAEEAGAAADEIERLQERADGYKGQVEAGAAEIERLRGIAKAATDTDACLRIEPNNGRILVADGRAWDKAAKRLRSRIFAKGNRSESQADSGLEARNEVGGNQSVIDAGDPDG